MQQLTVAECDVALVRILDSSAEGYAESRGILLDGIAAPEQLPEERFRDLLAAGDYRFYSLKRKREILGVAVLYLPRGEDYVWLDYMAIRPDCRNLGLGSILWHKLVEVSRAEAPGAAWFLLEVDDDREGSIETRAMNRRRIEFYRRLGARLVSNLPYRFPSPKGKPVPMRLMALSLKPGKALSSVELLHAIEHLFASVHKRSKDDPLLLWIREQAPTVLECM